MGTEKYGKGSSEPYRYLENPTFWIRVVEVPYGKSDFSHCIPEGHQQEGWGGFFYLWKVGFER